jgi:mycothiol system anti-sigma-R factor
MIGCAEAVRQLWEYLDETVDADGRVRVEEHLARCRTCCGELEFAKELRRALARSGEEHLPSRVLRRLHDIIEELGT